MQTIIEAKPFVMNLNGDIGLLISLRYHHRTTEMYMDCQRVSSAQGSVNLNANPSHATLWPKKVAQSACAINFVAKNFDFWNEDKKKRLYVCFSWWVSFESVIVEGYLSSMSYGDSTTSIIELLLRYMNFLFFFQWSTWMVIGSPFDYTCLNCNYWKLLLKSGFFRPPSNNQK